MSRNLSGGWGQRVGVGQALQAEGTVRPKKTEGHCVFQEPWTGQWVQAEQTPCPGATRVLDVQNNVLILIFLKSEKNDYNYNESIITNPPWIIFLFTYQHSHIIFTIFHGEGAHKGKSV